MVRHTGYILEGALRAYRLKPEESRGFSRKAGTPDRILIGCMGRAAEYYDVDIYGFGCASTHIHLLYGAKHGLGMAVFQCHFNGSLARELGRLHGWPEKLWGRRYRPMTVGDDRESQRERLKYVETAYPPGCFPRAWPFVGGKLPPPPPRPPTRELVIEQVGEKLEVVWRGEIPTVHVPRRTDAGPSISSTACDHSVPIQEAPIARDDPVVRDPR